MFRSLSHLLLASLAGVLMLSSPAFALPAPRLPDEEADVTVEVTARRWQEPLQNVPESVSIISGGVLSGAPDVRDAARQAPNLTLPDFSARWLTFPYLRGIGSGRNSPAVTTVIDGVPQLSYATGNLELLDVRRVEVIRGPQGSLYGRNTLGGVVNVVPNLPGETPSAEVRGTLGDHGLRDLRGGVSGPLDGALRGGLHLGASARDGFTMNDVTGHTLDDRDALFGRAQLYRPDLGPWSLRLSAVAECDRDGDYGLGDLTAARAQPHHVAHDYEGFNHRDVTLPVFTAVRRGQSAEFTAITALQGWKVRDATDADFSPLDYLRRGTTENMHAWTQEFRLGSPAETPLPPAGRLATRWLLGAFLFTSVDESDNFTEFRQLAAEAMGVPFPFTQHDTARLRDTGIAPYGQVALALDGRWDLTLGLRHDYERRSAHLLSYTDPALGPANVMDVEHSFNRTSPHASLDYHLTPNAMWYATFSQGYKTGGFNPQAPAGKTAYGEETSRNVETGLKSAWLRGRLVANLCLFRTNWEDIQLDVPTEVPGVFFIDNVGQARSQGGELELSCTPVSGLELFGGAGMLDARFSAGSQSGGADVSGHALPFAPRVTLRAGAQYARPFAGGYTGTARLDLLNTGRYYYDAGNGASQGGYTLVNLRLGLERGRWRADAWANNLFNRDYVPVAFPVSLMPSGYVGESGAPRTVGVTLGYAFP